MTRAREEFAEIVNRRFRIDEANGLARRLTQSAQSTDLRMYQPLSSRVEMYSVVQSSPVAPTTLVDCAT
jgi:hypothetical protein